MTNALIADCFAALGVLNATPLTQGGQKLVFGADLAGQAVVVKIVPLPNGPSDSIILERAHREVELLAAVDSPFVVKVLSEAVEVGAPPLAVAWVEERLGGDDLGSNLGTKWDDTEVFRLLSDVGHGLQACHDLAVVHRDLSPGNVRMLPSGQFLLMDPGYAKHLQLAALTGIYQPGTPGFRSPEHVAGGNATAASDVFGLGILAYYARTNTFPIDPTGSEIEYDRRLLHQPAAPIRSIDPDVSPALASIVDRCLQRQPARRFVDGSELLDALDAIGELR